MTGVQTCALPIYSIAILAATPPPAQERKQALADANAEISLLESKLGLAHRLMPIFNPARAAARLADLEKQLSAKSPAPGSTATITPAPRLADLTGDGTLDRAIAASGTHNLRTFKLKAKRDQLFAAAANLPTGSMARACVESNLQKAEAELRNS